MARQDRIGNHKTSIFTDDNGLINVIYCNTAVVKFNQDKIILNSGGYRSNTTKTRMNQASNQFKLEFQVYQRNWDWFVELENGRVYEFFDGFTINRQSGIAMDRLLNTRVPIN